MKNLGAVIQGLILGILLSYALMNMGTVKEGERIFRYQDY